MARRGRGEAPRLRLGAVRSAGRLTAALALCAPADVAAQDPTPLFAEHAPLVATLTADLEALDGDRRDDPRRPATFALTRADGSVEPLRIEVRTRGEFRRDPANCSFPPLRLDFGAVGEGAVPVPAPALSANPPFAGQGDLKLVASCRPGAERYERLVHLEYLAYRAYGLLTDRSLRVRPLRLTLLDAADPDEERGAAGTERFAFLIEDDDALAARMGGTLFDLEEGRALPSSAFDPTSTLMTALFEYMIGNGDWSDVEGHNVEIVQVGGAAVAVPYDFDFSGLVDAPYAVPRPEDGLRSVRERYYRGWCAPDAVTALMLERFRAARADVLALFDGYEALDDETRSRAVGYLEGFFDDIETDERAGRRVLRSCRRIAA